MYGGQKHWAFVPHPTVSHQMAIVHEMRRSRITNLPIVTFFLTQNNLCLYSTTIALLNGMQDNWRNCEVTWYRECCSWIVTNWTFILGLLSQQFDPLLVLVTFYNGQKKFLKIFSFIQNTFVIQVAHASCMQLGCDI